MRHFNCMVRTLADPINASKVAILVMDTELYFPGLLKSDEWDCMVLEISPICYWLLLLCYWKFPLVLSFEDVGGF